MKTKTCFNFVLLLVVTVLTAVATAAKEPDKTADQRTALPLVVVDSLQGHHGAIDDFDRLDLAFQYVAQKRKWPVTIDAERFGAGTPDYATEVRIFKQPLRHELMDELVFRGWVILTVQGKKHDFGIISFHYQMRPGENMEDALEKIFRGAAEAVADKIEPLLLPKPTQQSEVTWCSSATDAAFTG